MGRQFGEGHLKRKEPHSSEENRAVSFSNTCEVEVQFKHYSFKSLINCPYIRAPAGSTAVCVKQIQILITRSVRKR